MNDRISPEDWEILSAYLDGQASVKEQQKLKQKLATEPDLQRALDELQRTKMVLRSAPRRRVPHNFTLSPSMVPQRKPFFRLVPTLSFASGLAVLLLVLTFTFSGLATMASPQAQSARPPQSTQAAPAAGSNLAAPQADQTQPGAANPPIINWGGATGLGGGGGGGGGPEVAVGGGADPTLEAQMATEYVLTQQAGITGISATPVGGGFGGGPTPEPPAGGKQLISPELTPTVQGTPENSSESLPTPTIIPPTEPPAPIQQPASQATLAPGEGPILGIRPTQQMGKIVVDQGADQFSAAPSRAAAQAAPQSFVSQHLVAIQIGLGVLALMMALAAFLLHRRS